VPWQLASSERKRDRYEEAPGAIRRGLSGKDKR
jgi:hypothetical protein